MKNFENARPVLGEPEQAPWLENGVNENNSNSYSDYSTAGHTSQEDFQKNFSELERAAADQERAAEERRRIRDKIRVQFAEEYVGKNNVFQKRPPFVVEAESKSGEKREYIDCPSLARYIRNNEHYYFIKYPSGAIVPFWYIDGVYRELDDNEIKARIKFQIQRWNPGLVRMKDLTEVSGLIITDMKYAEENLKDTAEFYINFKNGLYSVYSGKLEPHTPEIFSTIQIPFDYIPGNRPTPHFDKFMRDFCFGRKNEIPDGQARYDFLMQWLSVCLSNISGGHFKKSLWFHGDGDGGKSVLMRFIQFLIGTRNFHSTDLKHLESRFGASPIYGKRLVIAPDMNYAKVSEVSVFKQLTGDDYIRIERKGKEEFQFLFNGLAWFTMNQLPRFGGDTGRHVYKRMIIFKTPPTIPEKEQDHDLLYKLKSEAEAIIPKILQYLPRVLKNGFRFDEPPESEQNRADYAIENSDVLTWLSECCVEVSKPRNDEERATVMKWNKTPQKDKPKFKDLYAVYKAWCETYNNGFHKNDRDWKSELMNYFGVEETKEFMKGTNKGAIILHFCLNDEAKAEFSGYLDANERNK